MGIGISIFLLAVGAILAFAVHASVNGIDLQTVGVILMVVGAIGIILFLLVFMPRRRQYLHQTTTGAPVTASGRTETVTTDGYEGTY